MERMTYRGVVWPQNPARLSVVWQRQLPEHTIPFGDPVFQDLGEQSLTVEGEGIFRGKDAMAKFRALRALQEDGKAGVLKLPGLPAITARLVSLTLVGQYNPDKIGCKFLFREDRAAEAAETETDSSAVGGVHTAAAGDNLWSIAWANSTTVEVLTALNPQIQWPGYLPENTKVVLPCGTRA